MPASAIPPEPSPRCQEALDEIDRLIDAGEVVDRAAFLGPYADVADELAAHFATADRVAELRDPATDGTTRSLPNTDIRSFGDYEIVERIGHGGMGVVFKARQRSLNRHVALKFPWGGALEGAEAVERCRQEALALSQLRHPNIVGIYEVSAHEGLVYLSIEYVPGRNLAELLQTEPPGRRQVVEYLRTAAAAIDFAHQRGIVHRDLKPANILLDDNGAIRITDFGLGKDLANDNHLTQTGQILGTLRYMAPEQINEPGRGSPQAGDIYALGAILYELLSGRPAFWANSTAALIRQIIEHDPPPLRRLDQQIPVDLETICQKCLGKNQAERYATAGALADDLQRFLDGKPVSARPIGRLKKLARWCRLHPVVAGLTALTMATIVSAVAISTMFGITAAHERLAALQAQQLSDRHAQEASRQEQLARAELARSERLLYASQISRAEFAWKDKVVPTVWETLSACKPELRGWEHDYLFTQLTAHQRTLRGHTRKVKSLAFTPDGRRLVSGSWDDTIKVWDVDSERVLLTIDGHNEHVASVAVSPDGRHILSAAWDNTARIWDLETGRELLTFRKHTDRLMSAKFLPDGVRAVSCGNDDVIRIWSTETGEEHRVLTGHKADVDALAVHPSGQWLASGGPDRTVRLWDVEAGEELTTLDVEHDVRCLNFSPDGEILVASDLSPSILLWRLEGITVRKPPLELRGHRSSVFDLAFAPENGAPRFVSASVDGSLMAWQEPFKWSFRTYSGHTDGVFSVAVSSSLVASGSTDMTIKLWSSPRYNPYNSYVAFQGHQEFVTCLAISRNGRLVITGSEDDTLKRWDMESGIEETAYAGHMGNITGVATSPDDDWIASSSADGTVKVWDMATSQARLTLTGHRGAVHCVAVTRDGQRILSGGDDGLVRVWDAARGNELAVVAAHDRPITCLALNPSGTTFCTGSADHTLTVWDADSLQALTILTGHTDCVRCVTFTGDGRQIVSGGDDRLVKLWDVKSGAEFQTLSGHTSPVLTVAVSPDQRRIVSGGRDDSLKLWDAVGGQLLLTFSDANRSICCASITPDGRKLVCGGENNRLNVWDASVRYTDDVRP